MAMIGQTAFMPDLMNAPVPDSGRVNFFQGLENQFTGNVDWQRQYTLNQINNAFNAQQAQINRDFQREMSNTAYQRAVSDLKKAGLNPALAATSALGASSPAGSAAHSGSSSAFSSGHGFKMLANMAMMFASIGANSAMQASKYATAQKYYDTEYLRYMRSV